MPSQSTQEPGKVALNSLRRFLSVYALASLSSSRGSLRRVLAPNLSSAQIALFPTILPLVFRSVRNKCQNFRTEVLLSIIHPSLSLSSSQIAAIISSPLVILLPRGLRLYFTIYVASSALRSFLRAPPDPSPQKAGTPQNPSSTWRKYIPPIWMLNILGNAFVMPCWMMGLEGTVPKSYEQVISGASRPYFSANIPELAPLGVKHLLSTTSFPVSVDKSTYTHSYDVCRAYHPLEPSCMTMFLKTLMSESLGAAQWVVAFESLRVGFANRARLFDPSAFPSIACDIVTGTIRNSFFVAGNVNSPCALLCLLQRLLPEGFTNLGRMIITGALGSVWIFALAPPRRAQMSLYVFRVMVANMRNVYTKMNGRKGMRRMEVGTFALGWVALLALQERGYRLDSMTAKAMKLLEA